MVLALVLQALATDSSALRAALQSDTGWREIDRKQVDGIGEVVVRLKEVGGQPCLEGSTLTEAPPDLLLQLATDINNQGRWSSWEVPTSQKLSGGSTTFDYFQVLDNPMPISDRYWFLTAQVTQNGETRTMAWELADPAKYPEALARVRGQYPNAVMTTINVGQWTFTPESGKTRVRYRICTDAGGNLPTWAGQYAAKTTLPTNVADLVREAKRRLGL